MVTHVIKVRVPDVDAAFTRAREAGARVVDEPTTYDYGERSCMLEDVAGHRWFSVLRRRRAENQAVSEGDDRPTPRLVMTSPMTSGSAVARGAGASRVPLLRRVENRPRAPTPL